VYVVVVVDVVTVLVVAYMGEGAAIWLAQCKVWRNENSRRLKTSLSTSLSVISDKDEATVGATSHDKHAKFDEFEMTPTLWYGTGEMLLGLVYRSESLGDRV
jgi:hypothetical protein